MSLYKESAFDAGFAEILDLYGVPKCDAHEIIKEAGAAIPGMLAGALGGGIYGYMNQPFGIGEGVQGEEEEEASPWYDAAAGAALGGGGGYVGGGLLDELARRGGERLGPPKPDPTPHPSPKTSKRPLTGKKTPKKVAPKPKREMTYDEAVRIAAILKKDPAHQKRLALAKAREEMDALAEKHKGQPRGKLEFGRGSARAMLGDVGSRSRQGSGIMDFLRQDTDRNVPRRSSRADIDR